MTTTSTAPAWLRARSDRCSNCGCHPEAQGHIAPCEPSGPLGLLLGREAMRKGMARAVAAHPDAVSIVDQAIMRRVVTRLPFSANTIRDELVDLSPDERPVIGARMNALTRIHCRKLGEEPSTDPGTHSKKVAIWVSKDAA